MPNIARTHVPEAELHAYCDGELSPSQRVEIAEHLLGCLICRAQHAEVAELRARVTTLLAIASPRQIGRRVVPQARRPWRASRMMVAAAVAMIGGGAWLLVPPSDGERRPTQLATSLGLVDFFRLGHGDADLAALRDRQLAMAMRTIAAPQVQAGPAAPQFMRPRLIGTGTEVDPVVTSEWTFATMDDALKAANGRLARVANIPVRLVRIHPSAVGGRPTFLIRQELADGRFVWVVEGLEGDIAPVEQLLQASGIAMSAATRTRPDYVGTGAQTTITVRMVRVVGYLPVDSLNVLAQKLVVR